MSIFDISNDSLRLMVGEMTAQEMRTVRAVLNGLKAQHERTAPKDDARDAPWISVDERLPDYDIDVLLYRPDEPSTHDPIYTIRERRANGFGPFGFQVVAVPTHWMPLPEAPSARAQSLAARKP